MNPLATYVAAARRAELALHASRTSTTGERSVPLGRRRRSRSRARMR